MLLVCMNATGNTLASVCKTNTGAVVGLQIKQTVNYEY